MANTISIDWNKQKWFTGINQTRNIPEIYAKAKAACVTSSVVYIYNTGDYALETPSGCFVCNSPTAANTYLLSTFGGSETIQITSDNVAKRIH